MDNSSDDKQHAQQRGLTRRGFLTSVGTDAVVAVVRIPKKAGLHRN